MSYIECHTNTLSRIAVLRLQIGSPPDQRPLERQNRLAVPTSSYPPSHSYVATPVGYTVPLRRFT